MHTTIRGRKIVCGTTGRVHLEQDYISTVEFIDYSWRCRGCGGVHCSECGYSTDGETITVYDCGRFDEATVEMIKIYYGEE